MSAEERETSEYSGRWHHTLHPSAWHLDPDSLKSAVGRFVHPTRAKISHPEMGVREWNSRSHRKHRYQPMISSSGQENVFQRLGHLFRVEYWNISWWVAWSFVLGSIVWIINGFAGFLPFVDPKHFLTAQECPGWTAWLGATIFELGSILGVLEAWNRNEVINFGWAVENALTLKTSEGEGAENSGEGDLKLVERPDRHWIWWSNDRRFWREIGFLAAFAQFCSASIFWISGFTAIPMIQMAIKENISLLNGIFWTPQVIGAMGFMVSGILIMLESQTKWYKPRVTSLGWHVGFWNFIGAVGFGLCGALGYAFPNSKAEYQSALSTFWGGWAFLIGSVVQLYECVQRV